MSEIDHGVALRREGEAATIAADTAAHRGAGEHIRQAIEDFAELGVEFTADDVREALRDNEKVQRALADRPNLLPALFSAAAKSGLIHAVGYTRATRASRHASVMRVWKGKP